MRAKIVKQYPGADGRTNQSDRLDARIYDVLGTIYHDLILPTIERDSAHCPDIKPVEFPFGKDYRRITWNLLLVRLSISIRSFDSFQKPLELISLARLSGVPFSAAQVSASGHFATQAWFILVLSYREFRSISKRISSIIRARTTWSRSWKYIANPPVSGSIERPTFARADEICLMPGQCVYSESAPLPNETEVGASDNQLIEHTNYEAEIAPGIRFAAISTCGRPCPGRSGGSLSGGRHNLGNLGGDLLQRAVARAPGEFVG